MTLRARIVPPARQAVKAAAALGDVVRRPDPGITILIYHRVGAGTGGEMDLDPSVFGDQLAWLVEHQRVLSLDQAADELSGVSSAETPTAGAVVLTFDDGTADWADQVLPLLTKHGVPATFYVATDFVDRQVAFPGEGTPISWNALRELASSDLVTIGSHTHRHLLLDRIGPEQIDDELDRSIELLRDQVGVEPTHFCYPKAVAGSPTAEAAVRRRFRTAVLGGTRANSPGSDLHRLLRSPVQRSDGAGWFRRKAVGGMRLEDDLRRTANRVRYRRAAS